MKPEFLHSRFFSLSLSLSLSLLAVGTFTLSDGSSAPFNEQFGVVYNATYQAPETGTYTFRVGSDDGFLFSIDETLLLSDISLNGFQVTTIAIAIANNPPAHLAP